MKVCDQEDPSHKEKAKWASEILLALLGLIKLNNCLKPSGKEHYYSITSINIYALKKVTPSWKLDSLD